MTTNQIASREEAETYLLSACERCLVYLRELNVIHLAIDGPTRVVSQSEVEIVLPLRKVCFHTHAITSWDVNTDSLHVMGPDIRAALKQLEPITRNYLASDHDYIRLSERRKQAGNLDERLATFSHPTPFKLILSQHLGGLGQSDAIVCHLHLYLPLMHLVNCYAVGLDALAELLDRSRQTEILDVMNRASADTALLSPDVFFRFVEPSE